MPVAALRKLPAREATWWETTDAASHLCHLVSSFEPAIWAQMSLPSIIRSCGRRGRRPLDNRRVNALVVNPLLSRTAHQATTEASDN